MLWFVYNALFAVGFALLMPKYLLRMWRRGGYRRHFMQRFGRFDAATLRRLGAQPRIWIHAVSVGEIHVALRFMREFRAAEPDAAFVLTTATSTAHRLASARVAEPDVLLYAPVDFPPVTRRMLRLLRPRALILTECELWPNLIRLTADRGIPVFMINGRMSDSSYRGYRAVRFVFGPILRRFTRLLVQGAADRARFIALGADAARVEALGTAKYDVASVDAGAAAKVATVLAWAGMDDGGQLLVGGSTWDGEERLLLEAVRRLRGAFPRLKLILVPRHAERGAAVEKDLRRSGLAYRRRSRMAAEPEAAPADVLLVDSTGELIGFYAAATLVFVGKSLTQHGGQNPIEAALLGKPVLFGPHMENFRIVVGDFLEADAAVQVRDAEDLEQRLAVLLADPARAADLGRRAAAVVARGRGVVAATVTHVRAAMR